MDADHQLGVDEELIGFLPLSSNHRHLLPNSSSSRLTSPSANNNFASPSSFQPKLNMQSGSVISKIEDILQRMVDCILDEEKDIVLHFKSRRRSGSEVLDATSGAIRASPTTEARTIRFPGRTAQEAWKFTVLLRILELSHESLVTGVVTTKRFSYFLRLYVVIMSQKRHRKSFFVSCKHIISISPQIWLTEYLRNIYYRDPVLFLKQSVVDRYIDDIAFNLGVKREMLNIAAAAKGLVAGSLTIFKIDEAVVNCGAGNEGVLVPSVEEIDHIDMRGARWALVIEKEATFRSLVASRFWETSTAGKGVLVTGKGYPDIQTRGFVRLLSTHNRLVQEGTGSSCLRTFALMDFDPDGLAIMSTYKHGSVSLAHENDTLIAPGIEWLGITSNVIRDIQQGTSKAWLRLSPRDRRKTLKMLENPVCQEEVEASWRRELQVMLMLNIKAEIQILGEYSNLEGYLSSELQRHIYAT